MEHPFHAGDDPPAKKLRVAAETGTTYSDAVRRKLQSASRTGQACDRCKERKMRCDANPDGCTPCRQKTLRCITTDRITGRPFERGQSDRLQEELLTLRRHLEAYRQHYGPLDDADLASTEAYPTTTIPHHFANERSQPLHLVEQYNDATTSEHRTTSGFHEGPIYGTIVDIVTGEIDIANFDCPDMTDPDRRQLPFYNNSPFSFVSSCLGAQKAEMPEMPRKEEAMQQMDHFIQYINPFFAILHGPSFLQLAERYFGDPCSITSPSETALLVLTMAIMHLQSSVRNPNMAHEKLKVATQWFHYGLTFFRKLLIDKSLTSMQALSMVVVYLRMLPKPGHFWQLSRSVLNIAISMDYHRSPDKLPTSFTRSMSFLTKEYRKRMFWFLLVLNVNTSAKIGKPMPLRMEDFDVELPLAVADSEILEDNITTSSSGRCNIWPAIYLCKLVPLVMDSYNNVISVRKPAAEYLKDVERLETAMTQLCQEWTKSTAGVIDNAIMEMSKMFFCLRIAEFQLVLHHPRLCTANSPEILARNLDKCHTAAKRILKNTQTMNLYRASDFTWHSSVVYVLALGITIYIHSQRKAQVTTEKYDAIKQELCDWMKIMNGVDKVLCTGDLLIRSFRLPVERVLSETQMVLTATTALQNGYPQDQDTRSREQHQPQGPQPLSVQETRNSSYPPISYPEPPQPSVHFATETRNAYHVPDRGIQIPQREMPFQYPQQNQSPGPQIPYHQNAQTGMKDSYTAPSDPYQHPPQSYTQVGDGQFEQVRYADYSQPDQQQRHANATFGMTILGANVFDDPVMRPTWPDYQNLIEPRV